LFWRTDDFKIAEYGTINRLISRDNSGLKGRICIATEEIIGPSANGGIGSTYYHLAILLKDAGHEVTVLYLQGNEVVSHDINYWIAWFQKLNIKFVPLNLENYADVDAASVWYHKSYAMFEWLSQQKDFDIVHLSEWRGAGAYSLVAKKLGLEFLNTRFIVKASSPHLWNRHYQYLKIEGFRNLSLLQLEQDSIELADIVIGGSAHLLSFMEYSGYKLPRETYVHPNVISNDAYPENLKSKLSFGEIVKTNHLAFFGRLELRKGLKIFCDALDIIFAENRDFKIEKISFLGKLGLAVDANIGDNNFYIKERAKSWNCEIQIENNFDQRKAIQYLVENNCLAIMPSLIENSTLAVYETLFFRIPFLTSSSGGTPELIDKRDRQFVLFESKPNKLADKLKYSLVNGTRIARLAFDNRKTLQEWKALHGSLIKNKRLKKSSSVNSQKSLKVKIFISISDIKNFLPLFDSHFSEENFPHSNRIDEVVVLNRGKEIGESKVSLDPEKFKLFNVKNYDGSLAGFLNVYFGEEYSKLDYWCLFIDADRTQIYDGILNTFIDATANSYADALTSFFNSQNEKITLLSNADITMAQYAPKYFFGGLCCIKRSSIKKAGGLNESAADFLIFLEILVRLKGLKQNIFVIPKVTYRQVYLDTDLIWNPSVSPMLLSSICGKSDDGLKRMLMADVSKFSPRNQEFGSLLDTKLEKQILPVSNIAAKHTFSQKTMLKIVYDDKNKAFYFFTEIFNIVNRSKLPSCEIMINKRLVRKENIFLEKKFGVLHIFKWEVDFLETFEQAENTIEISISINSERYKRWVNVVNLESTLLYSASGISKTRPNAVYLLFIMLKKFAKFLFYAHRRNFLSKR
jgi:glycosyltransferase involved in cell wall biosynthesis